jgi:hypothetical protein
MRNDATLFLFVKLPSRPFYTDDGCIIIALLYVDPRMYQVLSKLCISYFSDQIDLRPAQVDRHFIYQVFGANIRIKNNPDL